MYLKKKQLYYFFHNLLVILLLFQPNIWYIFSSHAFLSDSLNSSLMYFVQRTVRWFFGGSLNSSASNAAIKEESDMDRLLFGISMKHFDQITCPLRSSSGMELNASYWSSLLEFFTYGQLIKKS